MMRSTGGTIADLSSVVLPGDARCFLRKLGRDREPPLGGEDRKKKGRRP